MKTAQLIKQITHLRSDAHASLYQLSEPLEGYDYGEDNTPAYTYVIVSAAVVAFSGPETYIFPASHDGEILNWGELPGSFQGGLDHAAALKRAGYDLV